ncbi:uncharacterized protein KGF55_000959 [Candida pseudojiufengensis]|uniref:uncharacterized protein n=1 Tax=Candida pseudojiufengensis TaxID=497109 RepID=UPI0022245D3A|nr:uncharacterized protein KGF55_000959 [Candida pseudojiufengensis]KAI5965597.1 hypothetical protein KGF55_000959 [Candida pseudojiufengensis]
MTSVTFNVEDDDPKNLKIKNPKLYAKLQKFRQEQSNMNTIKYATKSSISVSDSEVINNEDNHKLRRNMNLKPNKVKFVENPSLKSNISSTSDGFSYITESDSDKREYKQKIENLEQTILKLRETIKQNNDKKAEMIEDFQEKEERIYSEYELKLQRIKRENDYQQNKLKLKLEEEELRPKVSDFQRIKEELEFVKKDLKKKDREVQVIQKDLENTKAELKSSNEEKRALANDLYIKTKELNELKEPQKPTDEINIAKSVDTPIEEEITNNADISNYYRQLISETEKEKQTYLKDKEYLDEHRDYLSKAMETSI